MHVNQGHLMAPRAPAAHVHASKEEAGDNAPAEKSCAYDFPFVDAQQAEQWNLTGAIVRAYGEEPSLTGLSDGDVTDVARRLGPRGPRKGHCPEVTADGECVVATCTEDTYGEITQQGAAQMFADAHVALKPGDVFFDLGSGLGKLVLNAAVFAGAQATGVELSSLRFDSGCTVLARLADEMQQQSGSGNATQAVQMRHLELRNNDMLKTDLRAADVVYVASLCFRPALMVQLYSHLVQNLKPGARVVSLRRFPEVPANNPDGVRLVFSAKLRVMMTWNDPDDPNPVFVYDVNKL